MLHGNVMHTAALELRAVYRFGYTAPLRCPLTIHV
jgi:hypothetical protein